MSLRKALKDSEKSMNSKSLYLVKKMNHACVFCLAIVPLCLYGMGHKKFPLKKNIRAIEILRSVSESVPCFYYVGNLTRVQR